MPSKSQQKEVKERSSVVVNPQKEIRDKKRLRKLAEPQPRSRPARPQIHSSPATPAPPATPASPSSSPSPGPSPVTPTSFTRSCAPVNSPSPCPSRPVSQSCSERSPPPATSRHSISSQLHSNQPFRPTAVSSSPSSMNISHPDSLPSPNPHSANSLQLTSSTPGPQRQHLHCIPGSGQIPHPILPGKCPGQESAIYQLQAKTQISLPRKERSSLTLPDSSPYPNYPESACPTALIAVSDTGSVSPPAAASTSSTLLPFVCSPSPTPPPQLDAASPFRLPSPPFQLPSPSPPASHFAVLPFRLDDIPERFHRFFL